MLTGFLYTANDIMTRKVEIMAKIKVEYIEVDGDITAAKMCRGCSKLLPLDLYYKNARGIGGAASKCRICSSRSEGSAPPVEVELIRVEGLEGGSVRSFVRGRKCKACHILKSFSEYHVDTHAKTGYMAVCKACRSIHRSDTNKDDKE
ncbi:hypothetical protein DET55_101366 [Bacillus mycoides]|uniref:Uncharacterized protein n=2 Tax=Bacillaceae TaxID=186817 RepID=A0A3D9VJF3_BACMY|nr:hypothetical protein DET63_103366 [Bacillus sp. DB-2]REF41627.1 hypothetical protein DET55_101366 [Bacillus mycoides]